MATAMITAKNTIRAKHPVREAFAGCTSDGGPWTYYDSKGAGVRAFDSALDGYGLCFDKDDHFDMPGDAGRINIDVYTGIDGYGEDDSRGRFVGSAVLTWYRLLSGRYEFVGYLT
jgi:hypothetical protein